MDYEKQALDFLKETNTTLKVEFLKHGKHFDNDDDERDIYQITLCRNDKSFIFNFGQSIAETGFKITNTNTNKEIKYLWFNELTYNKDRDKKKLEKDISFKIGSLGCLKLEYGKEPTAYDILANLITYDVGSFKNFCEDFGYSDDSRKAEKIYYAVLNEWNNIKMLYSVVEIEKLAEIQ